MEAIDIVQGLAEFPNRGAGTDAERRAASWLAAELSRAREAAAIETFWCRPNWAIAHAAHAALAVAGSLVSLLSPIAGIVILMATLASILADSFTGHSIGRLLTRQHASQNVVWRVNAADPVHEETSVRLVVVANYDAPRSGLVSRTWVRRPFASLKAALKGFSPGWLGWLAIATTWLLAIAVLRSQGHTSQVVGAFELPPTVGLLIAFALLLDVATAGWSPNAEGTAVGISIALARGLEATPPQHLDVELLLTGAGDQDQTGARNYLRSRRGARTRANTIVLGIAPCALGGPRWWVSDGPLIPLRYARPLRELARSIAADEPHLNLTPYKGRGSTVALPARAAGIPAITLGSVDQTGDADVTDPSPLDAVVQIALLLVDAIDLVVGERQPIGVTN